ncbi:hypothetical protein PG996_009379 [Apiospora saccharicola]|uniref:Rrn9 domain-containing protein n=1 Tax=Apiospora saccharicola TaxID=335842 RepID=A0ABR1UNM7_9PEZI
MGGPFAVPVPAYHLGHNKSRLNKRKRASDAGNDNGISDAAGSGGGGSSRQTEFASTPFGSQASFSSLPADSINPLSHSPDTLRQFAVAGLDPGEEVPSKVYPKFPHKGISSRNNAFSFKRGGANNNRKKGGRMSALTSGSEADVDTDVSDNNNRRGRNDSRKDLDGEDDDDGFQMNYSARMRHLSTLMAIMHRCLHEGDIPRAKRAFNLLIRTKDVDVRVNGLWNIGVEILMREGEQQKQQQQPNATADATADDEGKQPEEDPWRLGQPLVDSQQDTQAAEEGILENTQPLQLPERWGSAANIDTVREYLQSLIQQYPYDRQRPHMVSAVDFWPTLFSIEIYNLDAEFKKAMRQLEARGDEDGNEIEAGESSENEASHYRNSDDDDEDSKDAIGEDRETRRLRRREDARQARRHRARDEVRTHTRGAAEQVAARMDQQMENRPYTTHGELLRLRGMLSLYVADLNLCSSLVTKVEEASRIRKEKGEIPSKKQRKGPRSLRKYPETEEERTTSRQRDAEIEKARRFFKKKIQSPGAVDDVAEEDWVRRFAEGNEGDEDEDSE